MTFMLSFGNFQKRKYVKVRQFLNIIFLIKLSVNPSGSEVCNNLIHFKSVLCLFIILKRKEEVLLYFISTQVVQKRHHENDLYV